MRRLHAVTFALLIAMCATMVATDARPARGSSAGLRARAARKARKRVRTLIRKRGLAKLPSVTGALAGSDLSTTGHLAMDVVGTPPALVDIPGEPIKNLFWQPGVIDALSSGTATADQCSQFFSGSQDGTSGGVGACHMAETVGYSFDGILRGDTSLCYMRLCPTPANVAAGGVTVVSGHLPGGDITRLFSVPSGSQSRVVKVAVTGDPGGGDSRSQDVFLRVAGEAANRAAGNLYQVDLWFCAAGPSAPARGYEHVTIDAAGHLVDVSAEAESGDGQGGPNISTVEGYLTFSDGAVSYDTTRPRRAQVESMYQSQGFKADITIRSDDTMTVSSYDAGTFGAGKGYIVSSFSGADPGSLRFLAGAFKEAHSQDGVTFGDTQTGATEFRTDFYAAAPGSDLVSQLDNVDLDGDPFFSVPPGPSVDASAFACDTTPDVVLTLDFTNPTVKNAVAGCEDRRFDGMHFCHDDAEVEQAQQNYWTSCSGAPH
jgi:hypothetical protein